MILLRRISRLAAALASRPRRLEPAGQTRTCLVPHCPGPSACHGLLTRNWSGKLFRPGRLESRRVKPVGMRCPCRASACHVDRSGLEPDTSAVRMQCSTYGELTALDAVLCHLSYQARSALAFRNAYSHECRPLKSPGRIRTRIFRRGACGDRTRDLMHAVHALYRN
jgi:hypothetical protein